jgi:hypothetical protein
VEYRAVDPVRPGMAAVLFVIGPLFAVGAVTVVVG